MKNDKKENAYGKHPFRRKDALRYTNRLGHSFKEFYLNLGYLEHPPVAITSGVDPTVRFIGSHISVLKPYLLKSTVLNPGYFLQQDCLRTQNVKKLIDDDYCPKWGSYFPSLGVIAPADRLHQVCKEVFFFFTQQLAIDVSHIKLRISSSDKDLLDASGAIFPETVFEINTQKPAYYKHYIGEDGVHGRSFNIALRDSGIKSYSDIGNIILLETENGPVGIEIALGATTILKQIYNLEHVNDCYPFIDIGNTDECLKRKFEDAVISSIVLWREGIKPIATGGRGRVFRSYLRALLYLSQKLKLPDATLKDSLVFFEENWFLSSQNYISREVLDYVFAYKEHLIENAALSREDEVIKKILL